MTNPWHGLDAQVLELRRESGQVGVLKGEPTEVTPVVTDRNRSQTGGGGPLGWETQRPLSPQ